MDNLADLAMLHHAPRTINLRKQGDLRVSVLRPWFSLQTFEVGRGGGALTLGLGGSAARAGKKPPAQVRRGGTAFGGS